MTGASTDASAGDASHAGGGSAAARLQGHDHARSPDQQSRITLRANADGWIQIRAPDHSALFTGVLKSGDTYRVPDLPGLMMRAGNAGGLAVFVDSKPALSLGPMGAVRDVSLNPQSLSGQGAVHD
jgi:cytoskeleton protein RodZ